MGMAAEEETAMYARRHMYEYGTAGEQLAWVKSPGLKCLIQFLAMFCKVRAVASCGLLRHHQVVGAVMVPRAHREEACRQCMKLHRYRGGGAASNGRTLRSWRSLFFGREPHE